MYSDMTSLYILMPPLFLKLTKIWQQEHSKFVDFNDHTQVWRRPRKKRLRISTNDLYCQKHRVPEKKQATLIFAITSPSVEIFLQFLKHFVQEEFTHDKV